MPTPPRIEERAKRPAADSEGIRQQIADLWQENAKDVYTTAWIMLRNEHDAHDITNLAFLEATRYMRDNPDAKPDTVNHRAWLKAIARNRSMDLLRTRKRRPELSASAPNHKNTDAPSLLDNQADPTPGPSMDTRLESQEAIALCLDALPDGDRLIVRRRFFEDVQQKDIAQEIGVSAPTLSRSLASALQKLRGCMESKGFSVTELAS